MKIEEALYQLKQNIKMHEIEGTTSNQNEREKALLDYITNLQEENENRISESLSYDLAKAKIKELEYKIDKAIETIELWDMCGSELITTFQEKAINILQGKSDE